MRGRGTKDGFGECVRDEPRNSGRRALGEVPVEPRNRTENCFCPEPRLTC